MLLRRFYSAKAPLARKLCNLPTLSNIPLASESFNAKNFKQTDPRTVLFLHGFLGSKKNYKTLGKTISRAGINVVGIDMRNHGHSEHALPFDYKSMAADVETFVQQNKLKDLVVVGHSMGAKIGMLFTLLNPELVSSLVVVDNTPTYTPLDPSFRLNLKALYAIERLKIDSTTKTRDILARIDTVFEKYNVTSTTVKTFLLSNLDKSEEYVKFINPNYCFIENDVTEIVSEWPDEAVEGRKFEGPVLVVRSTQSGFIPTFEPFEKYFTNFSSVDVDASHYIMTEKGKEFNELLMEYLKTEES